MIIAQDYVRLFQELSGPKQVLSHCTPFLVLWAMFIIAFMAPTAGAEPSQPNGGTFIQGIQPYQVFPRSGKQGTIGFSFQGSGKLTAVVVSQKDGTEIARQSWDADPTGGVRKLEIRGVPVGGDYKVEFTAGDQKQTVEHLLVGELWIIGGQSNACGTEFTPPDPDHPMVHFLRGDRWEVAHDALFPCFSDKNFIGPWRRAAETYYQETGIPIGLLGWAWGGVPMSRFWNQNNYEDLVDLQGIVTQFGKGATTFLWYQGESDSGPDSVPLYQERLTKMVGRLRHYADNPDMLAVIVQLSYCLSPDGHDRPYMGLLRETQRAYVASDPRAILVPALPYPHFDVVHLNHDGYMALGKRIAEAVVEINRTGKIRWQGPRAVEARFTDKTRKTIAVRFESADGLRLLPHPIGVDGEWAKRGPEQDWYIQDESHRGYPEIVKAEIKAGKLVVEVKGGVPLTAVPQVSEKAVERKQSVGNIATSPHALATVAFNKAGYLQPKSVRAEGLTVYLELPEPAGEGAAVSYALMESNFCTITDKKDLPAATFAEMVVKVE